MPGIGEQQHLADQARAKAQQDLQHAREDHRTKAGAHQATHQTGHARTVILTPATRQAFEHSFPRNSEPVEEQQPKAEPIVPLAPPASPTRKGKRSK